MGGLRTGVNSTQHYANGTPAVNAKFPDLKALVDYGHSKGVKMGFYLNGCACGERTEHLINYQGDVALTYTLGFDGGQDRLVRRSEEHDALQRAVQRHRASHHHQNFPDGGDPGQMGPGWCPYNFFRTSGDIINVWGRVIENLLSTTKFLSKTGQGVSPVDRPAEPPICFPPPPPPLVPPPMPESRPGCWAYPDMLEVGRMEGSGQTSAAMSADESASHFAA